jgi:hypothetical protein
MKAFMISQKSSFRYTTDGGTIGTLKNGSIPQDDVFAGKLSNELV